MSRVRVNLTYNIVLQAEDKKNYSARSIKGLMSYGKSTVKKLYTDVRAACLNSMAPR